ncbi:hypothetical protein H8D30_05280, partial [bacterium]|nr:hypothetical protein [bacterium]
MKRYRFLLLILCLAVAGGTGEREDRWDEALGILGLEEEALGFRPKGYWARYPLPVERGIPYVLPAFNDLLAEPLRIHDYTNSLGHAA